MESSGRWDGETCADEALLSPQGRMWLGSPEAWPAAHQGLAVPECRGWRGRRDHNRVVEHKVKDRSGEEQR